VRMHAELAQEGELGSLEAVYAIADAPFDSSQGFTIYDGSTGELKRFGAHEVAPDFSVWSNPESLQPLNIAQTVSATRWQHEFAIRTLSGKSSP
jgi:hypothetical protein